mmetsp:Transcript_14634/g.43199  ORF Transcript_14634/g.43199 Transcript_14634/m.43199 type:complete len:287 (-) Transcript_14634:149-1009(-)
MLAGFTVGMVTLNHAGVGLFPPPCRLRVAPSSTFAMAAAAEGPASGSSTDGGAMAAARGRKARAARRRKHGEEGDRAISQRAHLAAAEAAGGADALGRAGMAAAASAAGGTAAFAAAGRASRAAAHPLGETGVAMQTGIGAAIKEGRYTKYPGVQFRRETGKWRVQFKYQAVRHRVQGQFALEADAARAHDAYVRAHGLRRPLHFPADGEVGSLSAQVQPSAAYRPRSLLPYAYERYLQASQPQLEEGATGSGSEEEEAAEAPREAVEGGAGEASTGVAATLTDVP